MEMNILSVPSNSHLSFKLLDLPSTVENAKKVNYLASVQTNIS